MAGILRIARRFLVTTAKDRGAIALFLGKAIEATETCQRLVGVPLHISERWIGGRESKFVCSRSNGRDGIEWMVRGFSR
jgi:hypothetical protein